MRYLKKNIHYFGNYNMKKIINKYKSRLNCKHNYIPIKCSHTNLYMYSRCECGKKSSDITIFGI